MSHDVQQVRPFEHPGEGRRRAKSTPKGRQIDPTAAHEIELLARRPAAAARSPDRASAPDPGQISSDFRGPSRRACRRDEAVVRGSVRDRDLLRAFRCGEGGRAGYRAPDHSGLRLAHLRDAGCGKAAARIAGRRGSRHSRGARALRRPLRHRAGGRGRPSLCRPRQRRQACWRRRRAATPMRICPTMSTTTPMSPAAAMRC